MAKDKQKIKNSCLIWEEELDSLKEKVETLIKTIPSPLVFLRPDGRIKLFNPAFEKITGYRARDVIGKNWFSLFVPDGVRKDAKSFFERVVKNKLSCSSECSILSKDGKERIILFRINPVFNKKGEVDTVVQIGCDITEQRKEEEKIRHLNLLLRAGRRIDQLTLDKKDEEKLFQGVCDILFGIEGYKFLWIGKFEEQKNTIIPVAKKASCEKPGFIEMIINSKRIKNPVYDSIATGKIVVINNATEKRCYRSFVKKMHGEGFLSLLSAPFIVDEKPYGVLCIFSDKDFIFSEEEVQLLGEISHDISLFLKTIWEEKELEKAQREIRQSLQRHRIIIGGIIEAIITIVEKKDPYTAGHQRNVARIASAIAKKMNLKREEIEAVRVAGMLHDVGKISVPFEILAKPGRLTENEMNIIKEHPKVGYEILKQIDFPWPVAGIVLQHHERVNGSGYPYGISDNEILLGARILAVADTIDAMSSHRPFRPALGLSRALKEIVRYKGILYDVDVVNACLKVFKKDRGFYSRFNRPS